jgi:hypothetical protein
MQQNAGLFSQHVSSIIMPIYRSTLVSTGHFHRAGYTSNSSALHNSDGLQVWSPESGTHQCTPEDEHNNARNMLSK